jgi:hypothetical protein
MARYIIRNVPYIYGGLLPCCHSTCLRMVLEFYGVKYSQSFVMNLSGFNYGFNYIRGEDWAVACTEFEPWDYMFYALEKMGCEITFIKDKPWDESWELINSYVNKDIPVYMPYMTMKTLWKIPFDAPHVVVVCGYDEEQGTVFAHDPQFGEIGEGLQYFPNTLPEGKSGSYAEFKIDDFRKACDLTGTPWAYFGKNALAVIKPPAKISKIPWAEVVERNARLTLGQVEKKVKKPANNLYGPEAIAALADDLEEGLGLLKEPGPFYERIRSIGVMAFKVGYSQRKDASSFTAGLAALADSPDLDAASYYLRLTGLCFEEAWAQVEHMIINKVTSPEEFKKHLTRISEVLRRAAEYDRKAGENLSKGTRAIK